MAELPGGPVRDEDAFDVEALNTWLAEQPATSAVAARGIPQVRQFRGGASNLTYALVYPGGAGDVLVLRRPPQGRKAASAHDMSREFEVQQKLAPAFPAVPEVLALCQDSTVIGGDFYVMTHVPGLILRADLPPDLDLGAAGATGLANKLFDTLGELHSVDVEATGLGRLYKGPGYVGRQVAGWSSRFKAAETEEVGRADDVIAWLQQRQPADVGATLIHGDWRFDNMVLDPRDLSVRAVLDWEMATVGDPLMDLGSALAYWVQADDDAVFQLFRRQPSNLAGMPSRADVVERYASRTGVEVGDWRFYEVFGLFRLAVIIAQIWFRFRAGQTTNPAFAGFGEAGAYMIRRCREAMR